MTVIRKVEREYVSPRGAYDMSGISEWWWRRKAYSGEIESAKVSTRLLIPVAEIRRVLAAGTRPRKTDDR